MFRKFLLAFLLAGAPLSAMAGDWTGFYAGLNGGFGWGKFSYSENADLTTTGPGFPFASALAAKGNQNSDGFIGGAQVGFNLPSTGALLLGVEADLDWGGIDTSIGKPHGFPDYSGGVSPLDIHTDIDALSTLRGRAGINTGNLSIYGTGGFAYGRISTDAIAAIPSSSTDFLVATGNKSLWRSGWTAGGGVEYPVDEGLSLRAEYLHVDLGNTTLFNDTVTSTSPDATSHFHIVTKTAADIIRIGFDYAFD